MVQKKKKKKQWGEIKRPSARRLLDFWACLHVESSACQCRSRTRPSGPPVRLQPVRSPPPSAFSNTSICMRLCSSKRKKLCGKLSESAERPRLQEEEKLCNAAKWHQFNVPPIYYTCDITGALSDVITEPKQNLKKRK